jgi:hypothetical protein
MIAPVTHILPLTSLRRARILPENGRVLVRSGQKIAATDVIAETSAKKRHLILDLRQALGLSRSSKVKLLSGRKAGEVLKEGDVITETGGIFKRVVHAPANCRIIAISGARLLLELDDEPLKLFAGFSGMVSEIIPDRGAIIEADGALLQGAWGNGQVQTGSLMVLARTPHDELIRSALDTSLRGSVVFSGNCSKLDALKAAMDLPVRGLILGSMTADLVPFAEKMKGIPIILLEGFGKMPVNQAAYKILTTNEKREVNLNAAPWDIFSGDRPEILIPLPTGGEPARESDEFHPGQAVRVHSDLHAGQVGFLNYVQSGTAVMPNGIRAACASIHLEDSTEIFVPLRNLDILE